MDSQTSLLKRLPVLFIGMGIGLIAIFALISFTSPQNRKTSTKGFDPGISLNRIYETYFQAWIQVQEKADAIRHSQEIGVKLKQENSRLRLGMQALQYDCHVKQNVAATKNYELKLDRETGSKVGRTLASLNYKVPGGLSPQQLHTLGISYLKAKEDEKAAAIFTSLTGLEDNDTYKTAKNYVITGVSWYRIENYTLAEYYFDQALKVPAGMDSVQYQAQARLWKAVLSKRDHKELKVQHWLKELVDHHPHSPEASWVNNSEEQTEEAKNETGGKREPAAEHASEKE